MKRWKRVLITGTLLTTAFTAGVYAEDVLQRVDAYLRPDFNVVLDGKQIQLESPTLVYADKTYLSLKELGNLLGASVIWKDVNKTIYINSRINPEQQVVEKDQSIEEFKFRTPYSIKVNYLGAEYPLMLAYADEGTGVRNNLIYYRLSDVRKMGIDTNGLKQSKEKLTGALYISEPEMKKRLKQMPTPIYNGSERYVIAGEINTNRIKALQTYVKENGSTRTDDITFTNIPVMIEKMDTENMYEYLYFQTRTSSKFTISHYISTKLILTKMEEKLVDGSDGYTINNYGWTDLDDKLEREVTRKEDEARKAKDEEAIRQAAQK
ncbi:copper amine oxidase N-terminal domain-containing protein [Paenibacillus sp. WQ 127069]|uniref:Copper amine oxidase N-terminal domain-containing protein n=1 Tax=Paenibacillus baimaensis TaxID=2982185 RepID=A0ABT2UM91_9BACL|nr:copper amine oxidase N-terminal domain-containing protein [Paenibacillus sp. WQ 127069]MCU6795201.1 copper amine oxidase N-terminal domain-containing protein [Paenibacillus sp. WQ 127069]